MLLHAQGRPRRWAKAGCVARRSQLLSRMIAQLGLAPGAVARFDRGRGFARAQETCLACPVEAQCRAWLDGRRPPTDPDFCANRQFFAAVRTTQCCGNDFNKRP